MAESEPKDSSGSHKSQRAKPRYAMNLRVEMFTKGFNHHLVEKTANISTGGLFVCTDVEAQTGEKLHLRVHFLDKAAYFDVKGAVVWVCNGERGHPKGLGVQFVELSEPQLEVIRRYLSQYVNIRDR